MRLRSVSAEVMTVITKNTFRGHIPNKKKFVFVLIENIEKKILRLFKSISTVVIIFEVLAQFVSIKSEMEGDL